LVAGLAIVPLYGIFEGKPAVKDLDLNQSMALSLTGLVWTYYGFLVVPRYARARRLAFCCVCSPRSV
jgi:hypothetical protein